MDRDHLSFVGRVEEARAFLTARLPEPPELALVLGTGLGGAADLLSDRLVIPYEEIHHFPRSTVTSHAGNLICGRLAGKRVAALQGRFHFYEGYSTRELTMPVRVLALLGAKTLLVSNAAGGLNPAFDPGTLMLIADHLNFIPDNPLRGPNVEVWGPRFPDLSQAYDQELRHKTLAAADRLGLDRVGEGVYAAISGPSLETPAETRYLRNCGADAVGMSTVPEVIVARHAGMRVLGLSVVANVNNPDNFQPILLEEIIRETEACGERVVRLLAEVLPTF
ncbi:purine-nucleoside phosphorylase [Desulfurivibrio sp. C05AmB]|uniref:purine-nucleoside phosphorylase n=1 Tax=Desulfurivibrio sp. C05AmB TaxID=3374371 RepID=UPI00376ED1A7